MPYEPCNYCKLTPFNKYDLEYGGYCDKPDGSRSWACAQCFSKKYHPKLDWEIPNWAIKLVQIRSPEECLERLRSYLFQITRYNPLTGFSNPTKEATYLRAETRYRMEVSAVLANIPSDPHMIHASIRNLADLLNERNQRQFKYTQMHEHELRGSHHYPWMALSVARAMVEAYGTSSWVRLPNRRDWSATINSWNLTVWEEKDGSGWTWTATRPGNKDFEPVTFVGLEPDEESAKRAAEEATKRKLSRYSAKPTPYEWRYGMN